MKPIVLALAAVLATNLAPLVWGSGDPDDIVDQNEPQNDACDGAEPWRGLTADSSNGSVGGTDAEDWSKVELYRTESLSLSIVTGAARVEYLEECGGIPTTGVLQDVARNGAYPMVVSPTGGAAMNYTVHYEITSDDAGTGADAGNTPETAVHEEVLPSFVDHAIISGSLPDRSDQPGGPDQDWFRISPGFPPGIPAVGLLSVAFHPDCDAGGQYGLTVYEADAATIIGRASGPCADATFSCLVANLAPVPDVYAKVEVLPGSVGTGYDFSADLSPIYVVNYRDGGVTHVNPERPACSDPEP